MFHTEDSVHMWVDCGHAPSLCWGWLPQDKGERVSLSLTAGQSLQSTNCRQAIPGSVTLDPQALTTVSLIPRIYATG